MVTIIFKTLEKCVSNCVYCDVIKRKQSKIMSYELLEIVFVRINKFLEQNPTEEIAITWHGGEITMLGEEYFLKAFEFQEKLCKNTKDRIRHNAQSNLLVINQEIIDALRRLGINSIGTSFDPIPGIRGLGKHRNSTLYNTRFFNSTELLKRNNISWSIINVVHKRQLPVAKEVYYYLTNLCDSVCFNEIYVYGEDTHNLRITGEEFADFLGEIFPLWLKNKEKINIRPFNGLYNLAMGNSGDLVCEFSGNCSHRWMYISPLGETSHCGKAGDYDLISYGNIVETELQDIINNIQRQKFVDRLDFLKSNHCKDCRFWRICYGGCFIDSLMKNHDLNTVSSSCIWMKKFMGEYFEPTLGVKLDFS